MALDIWRGLEEWLLMLEKGCPSPAGFVAAVVAASLGREWRDVCMSTGETFSG